MITIKKMYSTPDIPKNEFNQFHDFVEKSMTLKKNMPSFSIGHHLEDGPITLKEIESELVKMKNGFTNCDFV